MFCAIIENRSNSLYKDFKAVRLHISYFIDGVNKMASKADKYSIDMLHGPLFKKLIIFAMPLAATSILQQMFNSADVAVVGQFAGTSALAAVGANVANVGVFINFLSGFSVGPNVIMARMIGQGDKRGASKVIGSTITISFIMGLILLIVGELIAKWLLMAIATPTDVLDQALLYFRIYLIGIPFMSVYNNGAAILRSVGDTKRPLICLIISGLVNVALNLLFVLGLNMPVSGVAIATVISTILSCIMVLLILFKENGFLHLDTKNMIPDKKFTGLIVRMGIPAGVQDTLFSVSNMFVQSGINSFGSAAIAGSAAGLNFEYFSFFIVMAFSQATVTFASQNYGAGNMDRCKKVFWLTVFEGAFFTELLVIVFIVFRYQLVSIYTSDPVAIEYAAVRMMCIVFFEAVTVSYNMTSGMLRAFGYSILPSVLTLIGTVIFRIIWMSTVFKYYGTYESLLYVYPISWVFTASMTTVALIIAWKKAKKIISPTPATEPKSLL